MPRLTIAAFLLLAAAGPAAAQDTLPYRNPRLSAEVRARDLLGRMTLEEKFWQLYMTPGDLSDTTTDHSHGIFGLQVPADSSASADAQRVNAVQRYFVTQTRLGIPVIPFEEAVHGLVRPGATVFPAAIGLAASWDTSLMSQVAAAIAEETRARGVRQVLSPVVNLADDVRWGRVEETYGEDPWLASATARAYVSEFEQAGVLTTPKHFVANVGAGGRDSYPIDVSRRRLEEYFFPPFRAAISAGARSVMTAYNSVNGVPATQNRFLLTDILRKQLTFDGFVISDAAATGGAVVLHRTEPSTPTAAADAWKAGLDVVFQSTWPQYRPYWDAVRRGLVPASVIDSAVMHVLKAKLQLGLFDSPYVVIDSASAANGGDEHLALARQAANESLVLLKNSGVLPLSDSIRSVAVIGVDAQEARFGGYSGPGVRRTSILDGIRAVVGPRRVKFAPGPGRDSTPFAVVPASALGAGLRGEYFANIRLEGTPALTRVDSTVDFHWTLSSPGRGMPLEWYSVRWTGTLRAGARPVRRLGVSGNDGYRLYLDGKLLIDNWTKRSGGSRLADVQLAPGKSHQIRLEYFETVGNGLVRLVWDDGATERKRASIDEAVQVAQKSDVAIIVAGIEEGEFRDRARLGLPGYQEQLIKAVAATGRPVVVVLIGGSAITMSRWLDDADAVLDAWYPGDEGGSAVADALFGRTNPAGRLPITFPIEEGQLPLTYNHAPTGRGDDYVDLTGLPLFPFGYGLSYTSFEYRDLVITPDSIASDGTAEVRCMVRNTGKVAGDEVVQLYLRDELASVARPVMQLAGFARVTLAPGEEKEVRFRVAREQLQLFDASSRWVVEPGTFQVMVGASSRDIRLRGEMEVR
ncbi:MAG TPA: glycoside hydrolase family 3 N-terminal domain-containing protein [Gemmatimonadales bacterium]|nr:glycoside hydrolase family 3 N-terminal domain-containing protein [Gemmatimonadales bacterium]